MLRTAIAVPVAGAIYASSERMSLSNWSTSPTASRSSATCGRSSLAGCDRVAEAPAPSRPIERGLAGPGLLAHVIVSKFSDHLPLYRQSEIYARQGVEISRSTLAGWVGGASDLLGPLVDAIQKHVLAGRKLHADDTPMPVLAPGNGKTKTGRLWTYVRDDRPAGDQSAPAVWFAYSADRKGEHPHRHLTTFKGALQADAYAGFHHLYGEHIYEAACWAHARRKFHEIHVVHASPTTTGAHSPATPTTVGSRSTTAPPNAPCVRLPSDGRTSSSPDLTAAGNVPLLCTR
jgi:hypothetical protein